jgi:hypothetical protein
MVSIGYLFLLLIIQSTFTPKKRHFPVQKGPLWGQKHRFFVHLLRFVSGLLTNADLWRTPVGTGERQFQSGKDNSAPHPFRALCGMG